MVIVDECRCNCVGNNDATASQFAVNTARRVSSYEHEIKFTVGSEVVKLKLLLAIVRIKVMLIEFVTSIHHQ
ncbi:MAG TPA: hypothetical protein EYP10_14435 [Armatimonadetes bacterium]|nr:hypothetical protein [Armatimonadota bacterium]